MKLATFKENGQARFAVALSTERLLDVSRAERVADGLGLTLPGQPAESVLAYLEGGDNTKSWLTALVAAVKEQPQAFQSAVIPLSTAHFLAPVTRPSKIVCVGHNYREHILEMKREIPEYPVLFAKFPHTLRGHGESIPLPPVTEKLDYEAEFAFVIGRQAKDVRPEDALDYVGGYTIANDVSARDLQRRTIQWMQGKNLDGSLPLGPYLVTPDEVGDPHELGVTLTVNGETRQKANTRTLVFNVNFLVSYISQILTLEAGDIILTGTPGGVGDAMNPPQYLKDGDVVEITIDKLGTLRNQVQSA
ncbi:MAG: fumarylacetoacetate hydrolase family protein [Alicyclobacillus herbarius]|uniref:fumarylacetoacetate hydrolase family protein n=1 Tax=Alicyclobacillus herbarius TaxID=122960 RepID=UPI002355C287|nr:fumarylacetoacetate hydrolase family protein [Alicyclobacillus herbarius]MCL6632459.1 fumarylacetoacetate hydrolase family protein [Alicyclobacillus herbarius]